MEPATNDPNNASRGKWQWKSNPNPWSETEKHEWTAYSPEQNYLIEKAYDEKQKEVDLGDYIVSPQDKIQKKKGNIPLQRPIRRINYGEDEKMNLRSERYFETELPKTINKIFGSLQHFISFFSRKNSELVDLTKQFQGIEQTNDLERLNRIICPRLISSLEEELLKPIEYQLQDDSLTKLQKKIKLETKKFSEELIALFKREFISFEEFYGSILKSYTMNTALYRNLNKHLRNESWAEIENLFLYAICLCKAFFSFKQILNPQEEKRIQGTESSMILYRGTAFDEFALSSYMGEKAPKFFSWNSVTSTSTNRKMAENFMHESADIENKKYPVLFIIEIPLQDENIESRYLKWINIHQYSAMPNENEVILPPGSAFELGEVFTDQEKRTTINLKLKHDVESLIYEGLIMQGAFQNQMTSDKKIKIIGQEGEDLSEACKSFSGNSLIEEIEFSSCTFDHKSLEELLSAISSLKKTKRLKFISCEYEDAGGIPSFQLQNLKNSNIQEVEILEAQNFYQIFCNPKEDYEYWASLRILNIDFSQTKMNDFAFQGLGHLSQLVSLTLDFQFKDEIANKDVRNLVSQGLIRLTQLASLSLGFCTCKNITDEGVNYLIFEGFKHLIQLDSLSLDFSACNKITDEGLHNLVSQGRDSLTKLTSLCLKFSYCRNVIKDGANLLATQGLGNLTQLTSLTLGLADYSGIQDEGINYLASQELNNLTDLVSLSLDFSDSKNLTNKGMENLVFHGLNHLTQLVYLSLNFKGCKNIKDEGMEILASQGLKNLTKLTSLSLDFSHCYDLTNKGVQSLALEGLKHLMQLASLTLNFSYCNGITEIEFQNLQYQALASLPKLMSVVWNEKETQLKHHEHQAEESLSKSEQRFFPLRYRRKFKGQPTPSLESQKTLTLPSENSNFQTSFEPQKRPEDLITNMLLEMVAKFPNNDESYSVDSTIASLKDLSKTSHLTSLTLSFFDSNGITDEQVNFLASHGLKHLTQLTSLSLSFSFTKITDEAVKNLTFQGLKNLTHLTSLSLRFSFCQKVTDEGVKLASQGFKYLTLLTSLDLSFSDCDITDEGMDHLASQGLKHLTFLTSLSLGFSYCTKITDKGIYYLASQGFKYLINLSSLCIDFCTCKITDEGINYLSQGLNHLNKLTSLSLDFNECFSITDKGVENLISRGVRYLARLTSLTLDFTGCAGPELAISNIIQNLNYFGFFQKK